MAAAQQIPVVILCGGRGTRLGETTQLRPKPLVEIGDRPILWHVMASYARHGFTRFILCLGYKGGMIEQYFHDYPPPASWSVTCVDTGPETMTGGRVDRIREHIDGDHFMLTYADGLSDINIKELLAFHLGHGAAATVSAVRSPSQFGVLTMEDDRVLRFAEKPRQTSYINGGFFVFRKEFLEFVDHNPSTILEREPLERAAAAGQLRAFRHEGFWQSMDTPKDWELLNEHYRSGNSPWLDERPEPQAAIATTIDSLRFEPLNIKGAFVIESIVRSDDRGWFGRVLCIDSFARMGLETSYVQQNHSQSRHRGTIRGLHYQLPPHSEAKLIRCTRGKILDVIVDVRAGSPTFLQWHAEELSADDHRMVYVPPGCAHGFLSLEDGSEITYPVSSRYSPRHERGVRFDDPRVKIAWPITAAEVTLSEKDRNLPLLGEDFRGVQL